jgi:hypothetical protein
MTTMNINSRLKGVARVWRAGIGSRDFRTADLCDARAAELLELLEKEQDRGRLLACEGAFPERPELARARTADGGCVYYRARRVTGQAGVNDPEARATEVVALWTLDLEWRDDVAARLDALGQPPEDPAASTSTWVPLGDPAWGDDTLFARLWVKGKGCKYYHRGPLSGPEADEMTRLIVAAQSGPLSHGDPDRPAVLRLANSQGRLFALAIEGPDPDNPARRVPEVMALLTSDRNTWSREVGSRLRELATSLPRDEDGLRNGGWVPVQTTGHLVRTVRSRRFSLRTLLGWNGSCT